MDKRRENNRGKREKRKCERDGEKKKRRLLSHKGGGGGGRRCECEEERKHEKVISEKCERMKGGMARQRSGSGGIVTWEGSYGWRDAQRRGLIGNCKSVQLTTSLRERRRGRTGTSA